MDIQYKPTKQKKEKAPKTPKAPKAEKAIKFSPTAQKVKASKPPKPEKNKTPKQEKVKAMEFGKPVKPEKAGKIAKERKSLNPKVAVAIVAAVIAIAAVVLAFAIPAAREKGQQIEGISITATPNKTKYLLGEEANFDGLRVTVTRKNGETFTVRADKCQISGFDNTKAELMQQITVNYQGFLATFTISIEAPPRPTPALKSIRIHTMPKTEYAVGEWLDTTGGMLLREYMDGSTMTIALVNNYIDGWEEVDGPGTYTLTVKYAENGVLCTYDYEITVTE